MKKLFLLSAFSAIAAFNASAQSEAKISTKGPADFNAYKATETSGKISTAKTTATAPREYSHFDYNAAISSFDTTGGADFHAARIWADSTIKQTFSTGEGTINFSSVAQVIYPMDSIFNNPSNPANVGLMRVTSADAYNIDSVRISGVYFTGSLKSASIVDTLVISLTSQPSNIAFYYAKTVWAGYGVDLTPYLATGDNDTLRAIAPLSVDSVNRAALAYTGTPARAFWKVPLTAAMRSPIATAPIVTWTFAPPSTFTVPAGQIPAVTYTFKSGDTWVKNVDNIDSFHRFLPLFGGTTNVMPYQGRFHNAISDRSGSSLMFATHPGYGYSTSVIIEAENTINFFYEYLAASFIVSCPTCGVVTKLGIKELTNVSDVKVFPNPSNEQVNISFTAKEKATFTVSITNTLGQVVANQNLGMQSAGQTVNAAISTASLPTGIYMYTIESNGQRMTDRLSVAH